MSVYTHRFYEVKVAVIDQFVQGSHKKEENENIEIVPTKKMRDGYTVRVYMDYDYPYRIWDEAKGIWKKSKDCEHKWVLAKWYTRPDYGYSPDRYDVEIGRVNPVPDDNDGYYRTPLAVEGEQLKENICYCDNGGIIRDEFISSRGWSDEEWGFSDRGFPDDLSDDLKKEFEDKEMKYTWGHTYVTLDEWSNAFDKMTEKFKQKVIDKVQSTQFNDLESKMNHILKKFENPEYKIPKPKKKKNEDEEVEYYEDSMKYIWEEDFWDLMMVHTEMARAWAFTEYFGYCDGKNVRIVYYLS